MERWECEFDTTGERLNATLGGFTEAYTPPFSRKHRHGVNPEALLQAVKDESFFGMVECDISVPNEWGEGFEEEKKRYKTPYFHFMEFSPIFCNADVKLEDTSSFMQKFTETHGLKKDPKRLLVGAMKAEKILIASPLLRWYLQHGLTVTRVYQFIEYAPMACFKDFQDTISAARRDGDMHPAKEILADTCKLLGNSGYGSLIMGKEKHRNVNYIRGESKVKLCINDPRFVSMCEVDDDVYEVESLKRKISHDLPIVLGYFILQQAKLRMLEFYYDHLDVYVDRTDFEVTHMDTDCVYLAISGMCLEDVIKPSMKLKFDMAVKGSCEVECLEAGGDYWFPRECCERHIKYDRRTPGLFKLEAQGEEMYALCSKTYLLKQADGKLKMSCKGINKNAVVDPLAVFKSVLNTGQSVSCVNKGFRARFNTIYTYEQQRTGFSYSYWKRKLTGNGLKTVPLDITLSPCPNYNAVFIQPKHILGMMHVCDLRKGDKTFTSVSQMYEYEKAVFHNKPEAAKAIYKCPNGVSAAKIGTFIKASLKWYERRENILYNILLLKITSDIDMREWFESLCENTFVCIDDFCRYLGCGLKESVANLTYPKQFPGNNALGKLWGCLKKQIDNLPLPDMDMRVEEEEDEDEVDMGVEDEYDDDVEMESDDDDEYITDEEEEEEESGNGFLFSLR